MGNWVSGKPWPNLTFIKPQCELPTPSPNTKFVTLIKIICVQVTYYYVFLRGNVTGVEVHDNDHRIDYNNDIHTHLLPVAPFFMWAQIKKH
jgi:hypothetical protein